MKKEMILYRHKSLLSLFALTLILKVTMLLGTDVLSNDGPTYLNVAKQFLDSQLSFVDALRGNHYFYPALIAAVSKLMTGNTVESLIHAGQLLSLMFSVLSIVPFYLLVEKVWSSHTAFWAGLLFCVAPGINRYAVDVMRDPGYLLAFLTTLYLGWLFIEKHQFFMLVSAVACIGIAFLFRVEAFFLLPLLLFWSIISVIRSGSTGKRVLHAMLLLIVIVCLVGALSWYFSTDIGVSSRFSQVSAGAADLLKGKTLSYTSALKDVLDSAGRDLPGTAHSNDFFRIAKDNIRVIYFWGVLTLIAKVTYPPFFLLALGGIILSMRNRSCCWYLLSLIAIYVALGFFYNLKNNYLEERYIYSVVVILYGYAGYLLVAILNKCKERLPAIAVGAIALLLICVPATMENFETRQKWLSYPFKEAGLWLAAQPDIQDARLLANERKVPYYAGKYNNYTPFEPYKLSEIVADLDGYDYISIETGADFKDQVTELDHFEIVKQIESDRYVAVIYKRLQPGPFE